MNSNVKIGPDGRIYVDKESGPAGGGPAGGGQTAPRGGQTTPSQSDDDAGCGCLFLLALVIGVLIWMGVIKLDSSTPVIGFLFNDSVAVIKGEWQTIGYSGAVRHVIDGHKDEVYDSGSNAYSTLTYTLHVSSLGRFDARDFGDHGRGQAFSIGGTTYLLYDDDKDTLVCRDLDGSNYSGAETLKRIEE